MGAGCKAGGRATGEWPRESLPQRRSRAISRRSRRGPVSEAESTAGQRASAVGESSARRPTPYGEGNREQGWHRGNSAP